MCVRTWNNCSFLCARESTHDNVTLCLFLSLTFFSSYFHGSFFAHLCTGFMLACHRNVSADLARLNSIQILISKNFSVHNIHTIKLCVSYANKHTLTWTQFGTVKMGVCLWFGRFCANSICYNIQNVWSHIHIIFYYIALLAYEVVWPYGWSWTLTST